MSDKEKGQAILWGIFLTAGSYWLVHRAIEVYNVKTITWLSCIDKYGIARDYMCEAEWQSSDWAHKLIYLYILIAIGLTIMTIVGFVNVIRSSD